MNRYSIYAGRFTITDFFDDNNYTHDPRTQFMAWGVMYNGAWDYPADTRGYTWGIVQEFHTRKWAFRYGIVAEPKVANGSAVRPAAVPRSRSGMGSGTALLDGGSAMARFAYWATIIATQGGNYARGAKAGGRNGNHAERDCLPIVLARSNTEPASASTRRLLPMSASSSRLGWNDGKTQSFAFTAIDRLASGGVSIKGDPLAQEI